MVFMGCGFTSGGQESRSVFSTSVCIQELMNRFVALISIIQASKRCVESFPLVLKDKEAASLKVKDLLYSCLLSARLPSGNRMVNWRLETMYTLHVVASQVYLNLIWRIGQWAERSWR